MTKSLTTLTPSGVERWSYSSALANFIGDTDAVRDYDIMLVTAGGDQIITSLTGFRTMEEAYKTAKVIVARHNAALALPSEPPSQGDVEGRAREMLAAEFERVGFAGAGRSIAPTDMIRASIAIRAIVKALASKEDGRS